MVFRRLADEEKAIRDKEMGEIRKDKEWLRRKGYKVQLSAYGYAVKNTGEDAAIRMEVFFKTEPDERRIKHMREFFRANFFKPSVSVWFYDERRHRFMSARFMRRLEQRLNALFEDVLVGREL
jgi:hypothetical protein